MSHFNAVKLNVTEEELRTAAFQLNIRVRTNALLFYTEKEVHPNMMDLVFGEDDTSFGVLGNQLYKVPREDVKALIGRVYARIALNRMTQPISTSANVRVQVL